MCEVSCHLEGLRVPHNQAYRSFPGKERGLVQHLFNEMDKVNGLCIHPEDPGVRPGKEEESFYDAGDPLYLLQCAF
ncbi:MAG: hypothetical protein A4E64_00172 [Syntrophorhabdus sp. PtaU1.Bin058]|nr:MAG: hypothetical protein A4E64_00172 [Syntrophorhabdus sp. PtaU1.Bin058]